MTREAAELCEKEIGILGDLPGPKLRLGDVEGGLIDLPTDGEVELTTEEVVGDPTRLPVSWEGLPGAVREGGEVYLADGRIRLRVEGKDATSARCRVEVGGSGGLPPGPEPAGGRRDPAVGRPRRPRLGRLRGRARDRPARGLVRPPCRGPRAGRAADPHRRRRHPIDREDREAAGGRERRGDHQGDDLGDHGRPRRPRDRAARSSRCRACSAACSRSPASTRARRSPRRRCWPRWSPRRGRRAPRSPTSPTRSIRAPTP